MGGGVDSWGVSRALALVVAALLLAPIAVAAARGPAHPAVVDGKPVAKGELLARAAEIGAGDASPDALVRRYTAQVVVAERWIAGAAAARGLTPDGATVSAELERQVATSGGEARWRARLAVHGWTPESAGREATTRVLRRQVADALGAGVGAAAFGRAFDRFHRIWRARTVCQKAWAVPALDRCRNLPTRRAASCRWMGVAHVCGDHRPGHGRGRFTVLPDSDVFPTSPIPDPRRPTARRAAARTLALLPRAVRRRVVAVTGEAAPSYRTRSRGDAVAVARAALRASWRAG